MLKRCSDAANPQWAKQQNFTPTKQQKQLNNVIRITT